MPKSFNNPGRPEIISPTLNVTNIIRSAIELTAKDLQPNDEPLIAKCGEVDLLLSTNKQLRQELVTLIPILYETAFNTEGFPALEKYLWEMVGTLPHLSLLRLALEAVFDEFPEISAIKTKVYRMLKCYLSVTNHPAVHQFQDIHLSTHDFNRVSGANFDSVSGAELDPRPEQSLHTDLNYTYYSVYSQAQRKVARIIQESVEVFFIKCPGCNNSGTQCLNRTSSCPDLRDGISEQLIDPNICNTVLSNLLNKETQTSSHNLSLRDIGAQYSALADDSDTDYISEKESLPGDTQCHFHDTDLKYLDQLQDGNRTSTPVPQNHIPRWVIEEIIHHLPALQILSVEIIVSPGQPVNNQAVNLGIQRVQGVQGMAGR